MKRIIPIGVCLASLFFVESAIALDMEYYTYGGFNPIVQAFNKVALIFGDNNYKGLLAVVTVLGVLAAAFGMIAKAAVGGKISLTWPVPVIAGAVLYIAMFIPTGNITVYDPTLNRFQIVPNVPDAIVLTAGFLNKIEKGLVDIIDTASAPDAAYFDKAGGVGFKALEAIRGSSMQDNHARTSMIRYIKDCVHFEILRPGSTMSLDTLRNSSTNFLNELGNAVNPAIYTVYYDATTPEGMSMTCTEAWNHLQPVYSNPTNYDDAIKRVCSKAHFNPSNTVEMNTCESLISSTMLHVTGTSQTPARLIQQRQLAEMLYYFYFQDEYETSVLMEADRKIVSTGIGIGLTMNEWIPIIRAILTAIAIGTLPLIALFLPTPVIGRAASVMFGFFVFLTTWGITDAVIHGAAMDYASYAFEDVRQSNLGVYAMASFPNISTKMLAMFGVIRSAGIMLASIFSMMLVRFGGSALAHFATNLAGIARTAGSQAGQLVTPEGNAAAMSAQTNAAGLLEGMQEHRFSNMAAAGAYSTHKTVGGYHASMDARNALQESGQIPAGTTPAEFARMGAAARVAAGTSSGPVEVSTDGSGNATRMKGESVNQDGSTTVVTTGAGGTGQATDTMPAGTAKYDVDDDGNRTLTYAQVNGMNPVSIGESMQSQLMKSASTTLGGSTNWNKVTSQLQKDSLSSGTAQNYSDKLDNAVKENWKKSFNDSSSFVHSMDETTRTQFTGAVNAGGTIGAGISAGASGGSQISVIGTDGERVNFNVSEATAEAFGRDQARVRSHAIQDTFSDSQGIDYLQNVSKQLGVTDAYSFLNDARQVSAATASYGSNMQTAFVRDWSMNNYGNESPESIRRSMSSLAHMAQNEPAYLNKMVGGFVGGNGYGWGSTAGAVSNAINATQNKVHDDSIMRGAVDHTAGSAGQRASGVNPDGITPPDPKGLKEPGSSEVNRKTGKLRHNNRIEEGGDGRIQTTAAGMAKEGVGKVMPGMVDGQGERPTDRGHFAPPAQNPHGIGGGARPIPKDARTTLK